MPTTTNYGWTTPADTDLVKDGASAIRTLGSAIDTTVFNNANAAIAKSIVDAKGDLIAATAADTVARLAVGTNGQYLQADSTTATGLKWATVSAGGMTSIASGSLSGSNLDLTSIPGTYKSLQLVLRNVSLASDTDVYLRINNDSTTNYRNQSIYNGAVANRNDTGLVYLSDFNTLLDQNSSQAVFIINIDDYSSVAPKSFTFTAGYVNGNTGATVANMGIVYYRPTTNAAITRLLIGNSFGQNFDSGTYILYGVS